jgi:thymidylate kinase
MTKIIAVSGINGVGKTSLIRKLELRLLSGDKSVEVFKAPAYNTPSGLKI